MDSEGALHLKAGILGQYLLFDSSMVTITEDAYSPCRQLSMTQEQLNLPSVLDQTQQILHGEENTQADVQQMIDLAFYPSCGQVKSTEEAAQLLISGQFQALYYDPSGELCSLTAPWSEEWQLPMAQEAVAYIQAFPTGKPQAICGAGNVTLRADVAVDATTFAGQGIAMLTGIEAEEAEKPNPNRPSLILCRKGDRRLWDVAKETGSTVESIVQANRLDAEPESDKILLIPIK
jgi:hypothetical protein